MPNRLRYIEPGWLGFRKHQETKKGEQRSVLPLRMVKKTVIIEGQLGPL